MSRYDLVVIGSGPGGYVAAIKAAERGLKTACIEEKQWGGTCLNVGCIPSKTLLHASYLFEQTKHLATYGIEGVSAHLNFQTMQERKKGIVAGFRQGIGALFRRHQVDALVGKATLVSPNTVRVYPEGKEPFDIESRHILLATGSKPVELPQLPFDGKQIISSTELLNLSKVPSSLLIVGAGVIGVELGLVYRRLGAEVTILEYLPRICPSMDKAVSQELQASLEKQAMTFILEAKVIGSEKRGEQMALSYEKGGHTETIEGDLVLCAVGRRPYTQGLGLETVGLSLQKNHTLEVNGCFQTKVPSIYAIGDLIEGPMLAHRASEEGEAVARMLAQENSVIDYLTLPSIIYTEPEAASVGLTEEEATEKGFSVITGTSLFKHNSRAVCSGKTDGFVKIVADQETMQLLGLHIVGACASELIMEGVLALKTSASVSFLAESFHGHPTLSETIKEAAMICYRKGCRAV